MRVFKEYATVYAIGSVGYSLLEVLWRGFTHWTMAFTGGLCLLTIYRTNLKLEGQSLLKKCFVGATIITSIEFVVGCVVNIMLGWDVWDYSDSAYNLMGQICLPYYILWFLLCIPVALVCKVLNQNVFSHSHS